MMRRTPIGVPNPRLLSPAGTRQPGNGHCTSASRGDAADAAAETATEEADFTVYLVDDDPDVRRALSRAISTRGLAVSTFDRAEAFLEAYDPARPGCLILDYGLPGMSGLDLQAQVVDQGHPCRSSLSPAMAAWARRCRRSAAGPSTFSKSPSVRTV